MSLDDKISIQENTTAVMVFVDSPYLDILSRIRGLRWHAGAQNKKVRANSLVNEQKPELKYKRTVTVYHRNETFSGLNGKKYESPFTARITANAINSSGRNADTALEEFVNAFVGAYLQKGGRVAVWACNSELYFAASKNR